MIDKSLFVGAGRCYDKTIYIGRAVISLLFQWTGSLAMIVSNDNNRRPRLRAV